MSEGPNLLDKGQIAEVGEATAKQCGIDDLEHIIGSIHGIQLRSYCQVYTQELCKAMLQHLALELRGGAGGCAPVAGSACFEANSRKLRA